MDYGVIKFKNTDKSVGVSGTEWKFKYSPESVFHGFTLGKHNNSFSNSNSTKKGEAEYSGFLGITSHKLSAFARKVEWMLSRNFINNATCFCKQIRLITV